MTVDWPHLDVLRVTLEARTPLSVSTGLSAGLFDTALVRDADGLPAIPGSSLAGVLRHLWSARYGGADEEEVFGHRIGARDGHVSRLGLTWARVHDSTDRPVDGRLDPRRIEADPVLRWLAADAPLSRHHVRIGARGTADGRGKFDRTSVPAGARFTLDLLLWSPDAEDGARERERLLALLADPRLRVGGATRRGLGRVEPVRVRAVRLDLRTAEGRDGLRRLPRRLDADFPGERIDPPVPDPGREDVLEATVELAARDLWRIGEGTDSPHRTVRGEVADMLPLRERRILWKRTPDGDRGGVSERAGLVLPGSSLKGALRHRTLFHLCRELGIWAERLEEERFAALVSGGEVLPELESLFGSARDDTGDDARGRRGRVVVDDVFLPFEHEPAAAMMPHVGQDRFTGGVRTGILFVEELVARCTVGVTVRIEEPARIPPPARRALARALADLASGRLALGGGTGRGHGTFTGTVTWSDGGRWAAGEEPC